MSNAIDFLTSLPGPLADLTAIHPTSGKIIGHSFDKANRAECEDWITAATARGYGVYFNVNGLDIKLTKERPKAKTSDVTVCNAFHVDADVSKDIAPAEFAAAKAELLRSIRGMNRPPTIIIDSGNGFGLFWMLRKPVKVTDANRDQLTGINIALRDSVPGAADACQNLDRVMRVPYTTNFPNATKIKRGRVEVQTDLITPEWADMGAFYSVEDFEAAPPVETEPEETVEAIDIPDSVDMTRLDAGFTKEIVEGVGSEKHGDSSRSAFAFYVASDLIRLGFTDGEIVWVLTNPYFKVSDHVLDQKQRTADQTAMRIIREARARGAVRAPTAEEVFAADPPDEITPDQIKPFAANVKPAIKLQGGELPKIVRRVQKHLVAAASKPGAKTSDQIFQRGGELVHLSRNKLKPRKPGETVDKDWHVEDALIIKRATRGWLTDRAMRAIDFYVEDIKGKQDKVDAPARVIDTLGEIGTSWNFPVLKATVETPTLRSDGSVLEKFGYDPQSRLFLDTGGIEFPPIKDKPTRDDALAALAILLDPLQDFQFKDDDGIAGLSRAVQLSAMLTACVRRSMPYAPAYGFDGNDVSAGKTQLAQINSIMATGRRTGDRPFTNDADEQRKLLSAAFAAGDAVLLFDNLETEISGGPLCSAITDAEITTRRLGGNSAADQITAPTNALMMFTGNGLIASGDMTDRVLITKLFIGPRFDAGRFKYKNLDAHLIKNRPVLVAAALTIIRAYLAADCPKVSARGSRYPDWQRFASDPLVWLGQPDPVLSFDRAVKSDPVRENFAPVLRGWLKLDKPEAWRSTAALLGAANIAQAIADARAVTLGSLTPRNASEYLKGMVEKTVEGYRVEKAGGTLKHATTWRIVRV
ncbi:MAG TPA: hypothetical protein VN742_09570 [Candidatus Binataceae bacterium]|nr:hypothetical protein [Candidatus Binataceae bacterium]